MSLPDLIKEPGVQRNFRNLNSRIGALELSRVLTGNGSPEAVVAAPVGALYTRLDGGAGATLYVKESGSGATGWAAK